MYILHWAFKRFSSISFIYNKMFMVPWNCPIDKHKSTSVSQIINELINSPNKISWKMGNLSQWTDERVNVHFCIIIYKKAQFEKKSISVKSRVEWNFPFFIFSARNMSCLVHKTWQFSSSSQTTAATATFKFLADGQSLLALLPRELRYYLGVISKESGISLFNM